MKVTTSTVPSIPAASADVEAPSTQPTAYDNPASEQPLQRSKRGLKSFLWFGKKPSPPSLPPKPALSGPALPPKSPLSSKSGPFSNPGQNLDTFKGAGQTIVHANKIKVQDELLLTNLRKQAPMSVADAAKRLIDADKLVKAGVIPTAPKASRVARDAFISAGITGMVSAPINVASYAGSVATGESIKANYAPGVLPPPFLPGAGSTTPSPATSPVTSAPPAPDPISARLEEAEMKLLGMASTVMFTLGDTQSVFTKDKYWPTDNAARLDNLEKLLGVSEQQLKKAARQNGLVFKPYKPGEVIPTQPEERLDLIDKKFERMIGSYEKLRFIAAMKDSEGKTTAAATA
ncbi:hypothetical protein [Pseudomonas fluorescens]|uniref:hypothetical protein n=1 Tax=Pseudomonas fluorescens TaxID=294 RepID=UPI0004752A93|nr:hypothetical protein [Pseudomonas fluorescens]